MFGLLSQKILLTMYSKVNLLSFHNVSNCKTNVILFFSNYRQWVNKVLDHKNIDKIASFTKKYDMTY